MISEAVIKRTTAEFEAALRIMAVEQSAVHAFDLARDQQDMMWSILLIIAPKADIDLTLSRSKEVFGTVRLYEQPEAPKTK
jgi:hypothetical protein